MRSLLCIAAAIAVAQAAFPAPGTAATFEPSSNSAVNMRHCDYVCSVDPLESGNEDFQFNVIAPLNGNNDPSFVSFSSANVSAPLELRRVTSTLVR